MHLSSISSLNTETRDMPAFLHDWSLLAPAIRLLFLSIIKGASRPIFFMDCSRVVRFPRSERIVFWPLMMSISISINSLFMRIV